VLACKVLQCSGEERLWEEESGDPEHLHYTHAETRTGCTCVQLELKVFLYYTPQYVSYTYEVIISRIVVLRTQMQSIVTNRVEWCVDLSVCHTSEPCKNSCTDRDAV